jgi:carboxyl-terminal processing protease
VYKRQANILGQNAINSLSHKWRKTICPVLNDNIKGYMIDLRLNMGGNMYPMLSVVSHLMGDKKVAGTTNQNGHVTDWWELKQGDVYLDTTKLTYVGPHCLKREPAIPVAVLTSYFTISSGEIMTVAFKKRPHTIQVGDTTGGLVTNNHYYQVAGDTYLNLSVGYFADREGTVYKTGIQPDIYLRGDDDFTNTTDDKKVKAALAWLQSEIHKP